MKILLNLVLTLFSLNSFSQHTHTFVVDGLNTTETVTVGVGDTIVFKSGNNGSPYDYYVDGVLFGDNIPSNSFVFDTIIDATTSPSFTIHVTTDNTFLYKNVNVIISTAGISENVVNYSVYPNPTTDFLNINGVDITSVKVFDMNGRMVLNDTGNRIDVSSLEIGSYIVLVNGIKRIKFLKN